METKIYVDVLLTINYLVNTLLILCTAKLTGRKPTRRRLVAAALFGSACSLAIFLPFLGFFATILSRLLVSGGIVLIAFRFFGWLEFGKQWFVFFAVSFFFAGIMLGLWMLVTPRGMMYSNGVVYFHLQPTVLLLSTGAAYGLLSLFNRFSRDGRLRTAVYEVEIHYRGQAASARGLVDTGNSLQEPFSDSPVMVVSLDTAEPLLPTGAADDIRRGRHMDSDFLRYGLHLRMIPYGSVGGGGLLPAFRADKLVLKGSGGTYEAEGVYVAMSGKKIGGALYNAVLNPDIIGVKSIL